MNSQLYSRLQIFYLQNLHACRFLSTKGILLVSPWVSTPLSVYACVPFRLSEVAAAGFLPSREERSQDTISDKSARPTIGVQDRYVNG